MFVPVREEPRSLLSARKGECENGISRPFSAGAGASVLVAGLVIVPYVLNALRKKVPKASPTLIGARHLPIPRVYCSLRRL